MTKPAELELADELERSVTHCKSVGAPGVLLQYTEIPEIIAVLRARAPAGWRLVPENPPVEQWEGLPRAIIFWHDLGSGKRTPASLFQFLNNLGEHIPQWLRDESEMQNLDHAISKGTRAVLVYKAFLSASPAAPQGDGWLPIASAPKDGTIVLLGWSGEREMVMPGRYCFADLSNTPDGRGWIGWSETCGEMHCAFMTHWQPLLPPPSLAASPAAPQGDGSEGQIEAAVRAYFAAIDGGCSDNLREAMLEHSRLLEGLRASLPPAPDAEQEG